MPTKKLFVKDKDQTYKSLPLQMEVEESKHDKYSQNRQSLLTIPSRSDGKHIIYSF